MAVTFVSTKYTDTKSVTTTKGGSSQKERMGALRRRSTAARQKMKSSAAARPVRTGERNQVTMMGTMPFREGRHQANDHQHTALAYYAY